MCRNLTHIFYIDHSQNPRNVPSTLAKTIKSLTTSFKYSDNRTQKCMLLFKYICKLFHPNLKPLVCVNEVLYLYSFFISVILTLFNFIVVTNSNMTIKYQDNLRYSYLSYHDRYLQNRTN